MAGTGKGGRPSIYSKKIADEICRRLAGGESLVKICEADRLPHRATVLRWLFDGEHEEFRDRYVRAREAQAECWADEIVMIADATASAKNPQHGKLRVDARKWVAAKLLPKKYGERTAHELSGPDGGPIPTRVEVVIVDAEDAGDPPA